MILLAVRKTWYYWLKKEGRQILGSSGPGEEESREPRCACGPALEEKKRGRGGEG